MPKLLFQGHGSYRLTADDGRVIYVDPYAGKGYDLLADVILITHQHGDHNKIQLCRQKQGCRVITNAEALAGGKHNSLTWAVSRFRPLRPGISLTARRSVSGTSSRSTA